MVDEVFVGQWKGCESGLEVVLKGLQKKTLKKVAQKFGDYENTPYLCTRNLNETTR